ncbi:MAG: IS30 family transposase [Candidatus Dadabacteria bacterium]|nr:IS30 family transposase [Candidatus Dadabacteria bacterium]
MLIRVSPWERGTSENTNGLIRQFFAKGTDFTLVNNEQLKRAQDLLNDRSKVLDWKKSDEVLASVLH